MEPTLRIVPKNAKVRRDTFARIGKYGFSSLIDLRYTVANVFKLKTMEKANTALVGRHTPHTQNGESLSNISSRPETVGVTVPASRSRMV